MKSIYDAEYRSLIARLIQLRKGSGITQKQLALKLGCPQPFISKIETFTRRLDLIETIRFCEALGITIEQFLADWLSSDRR